MKKHIISARYTVEKRFVDSFSPYLQYIIFKKDPLEIQHPKFENSRLSFIESVHER